MTNNMTEIKQSKIKLFIGWVVSHAVSIGLIGIGLALFLSSCQKAKASEQYLPNGFSDILSDDMNTFGVSNYYDTVYNSFANKMTENGSISRLISQDGSFVHYVLFPVPDQYYQAYSGISNFDNNSVSVNALKFQANDNNTVRMFANLSNSQLNQGDTIYLQLFMFYGGRIWLVDNVTNYAMYYNMSRSCYLYNYDLNSFGEPISSNVTYNGYYGSANWIIESGYSPSYNTICNISDIITYNGFGFQTTGNNYSIYYFEDNWEKYFPSAVSDDRLEIYKTVSVSGTDNLNIDLSKFRTGYSAAVSKTFSDVTVTVNYDGTDQQFILNDTNSQIVDSFNPTNEAYIVITPFSFFGIDSYQDVYISEVDFTLTTRSAGGSGTEDFHILCEYYLKHTNVRPQVEDILKDSDVDGTKLTIIEYDNVKNKINFSDGYYSPLGGGGNELVVPYGYNVLYVTITGSRTLASIINEIVTDNYLEILLASGDPMTDVELSLYLANEITSSITGITSTADAENLIKEYIKNNYYTNMFDIVVYYWAPDSSLGEVDVMYYYLTESGRLRGISQILADVYRESNQISVNTKATYEFLYDKLNDFENMTLEAIWGDSPFSVFNSIDKLDNDFLSSVSRIIDAMPTFTPYDDHDVVYELGVLQGLLETIIENQDSPHDGYPKYISWVKNFDDLDGFGNWSESVLSTFKNVYSFFNYREDINVMETGLQTYVTYVDRYVDMLLGNSEEDLAIQSRYYLSIYDGTYDVHNINGGS